VYKIEIRSGDGKNLIVALQTETRSVARAVKALELENKVKVLVLHEVVAREVKFENM
jgi:hypothetical protein